MPDPKRLTLGGPALPLDIDSLEAALPFDGGLIQFDFTFRGTRFAVRCEEGHGTDGSPADARLRVVGDVGPMPFSAESPTARAGLSAIILHANGLLGRVFRLTEANRIVLGTETDLPLPVTATRLVTALARFLIPAAGYLDLVGVYVQPGGAALKPEWRRRRPATPFKALPKALPR